MVGAKHYKFVKRLTVGDACVCSRKITSRLQTDIYDMKKQIFSKMLDNKLKNCDSI